MYKCFVGEGGGLNFLVKKESKHSIFAGNILSQRSVSHARSKIATEKFKSSYVKWALLKFMPKFFTNTNMVKITNSSKTEMLEITDEKDVSNKM